MSKKSSVSSSSKKTNDNETLIYTVIAVGLIGFLSPSYIVPMGLIGGVVGSSYGIINILDKYKSIDEMNFVSKESIKYFKK